MMRASLLALLLALAAPDLAAMPRDGAIGCNPEGAQLELDACAADTLAEADAELNGIWKKVLAAQKGDAVALARLKAAQRLWIQLRDADLQAQFPLGADQDPRVQYGSMYPMSFALAKAELTRDRIAYLRSHFLIGDGY